MTVQFWEAATAGMVSHCLNEVLQLVETFETNLLKKNSHDEEKLVIFNKAYELWKEYLDADCRWQYSEYRDGTIRYQKWLNCSQAHYENRILLLNGPNRFQGKDSFLEE